VRRDHDHLRAVRPPLELPNELQAVHSWHQEVGNDQVVRFALHDLQRLDRAGQAHDLVPRLAQRESDAFPRLLVVVHNEYPTGRPIV
jgi:hypothetical protein